MAKNEKVPGAGERFGPEGYENWRHALNGVAASRSGEIPLYSDTSVTGEVTSGWGPYRVLNTIAAAHAPGCLPVLVLRFDCHPGRETDLLGAEASDASRFHGGSLYDEIAALIGLRLGIRLRASSVTRDVRGDTPFDRPLAEDPASVPALPRRNPGRPSVWRHPDQVEIGPDALENYPLLRPCDAVALVRAARLYQSALWTCDADPATAWLMLVSAVEVTAVEWRRGKADDDPETLLRELKPQWAERLELAGGAELVREMAAEWSHLLGATNRFIKFTMEFMPEPPTRRPSQYRVDWSPSELRRTLQRVYELRSEALHAGIPFPAPMCSPPDTVAHGEPAVERPVGLASSSWGAIWMADDVPIHLHVFAHIVRGALLRWWGSLASAAAPAPARPE